MYGNSAAKAEEMKSLLAKEHATEANNAAGKQNEAKYAALEEANNNAALEEDNNNAA
jgi:hypothetical protein